MGHKDMTRSPKTCQIVSFLEINFFIYFGRKMSLTDLARFVVKIRPLTKQPANEAIVERFR